jgi:quercetin dioxygenase-like cupin family protein
MMTCPKSAFIYATVLEGAIRSQVNDGPVVTYKAGQSFSELLGDRHGVTPAGFEPATHNLEGIYSISEFLRP